METWGNMIASFIAFVANNRILIGFSLVAIYFMYVGHEYLSERRNEHGKLAKQP